MPDTVPPTMLNNQRIALRNSKLVDVCGGPKHWRFFRRMPLSTRDIKVTDEIRSPCPSMSIVVLVVGGDPVFDSLQPYCLANRCRLVVRAGVVASLRVHRWLVQRESVQPDDFFPSQLIGGAPAHVD
jgi:hypothetical protein